MGQLLAEFIAKIADDLHARGRTVIFWGEYPLKPGDIAALPPHLINGETYGPEFDPAFRARGIRQTIYTSSEGEEPLFPDYFVLPASRRLHPEPLPVARVEESFRKISFDPARRRADVMGMLNAGWADRGLHPETFWLGYAASASAGWHPAAPDPAESRSSFYALFYGADAMNMDRVYQLMAMQAQFWNDSWETAPSTARKPIFGNSNSVFDPPRPAKDQTLSLPAVDSPAAWLAQNARRLQLSPDAMADNDELLGLLHENLRRVDFNRYNLEVFLTVARICRHNLEMLSSIGRMARLLDSASSEKDGSKAVADLDRAVAAAQEIRADRNSVLRDAAAAWYKTCFPRVAEANGRRFVHELDDVKDHLPDRTIDMSYLVHRELLLPFGEWVERVRAMRNSIAEGHAIAAERGNFDWKDLEPVEAVPK